MPANIQLKILSKLTPELYQDPDADSDSVPVLQPTNSTPFNFAEIVQQISQLGFAYCDGVFDLEFVRGVSQEVFELEMSPGKMALQWQEESMRGDRFVWLQPSVTASHERLTALLGTMNDWREQFNAIISGDLTYMKFMAAIYPGGGARYVRHSVCTCSSYPHHC